MVIILIFQNCMYFEYRYKQQIYIKYLNNVGRYNKIIFLLIKYFKVVNLRLGKN